MSDEERRYLTADVRYLTARLGALYSAQYRGDRTQWTGQRVERLEALLAALQGHPDAMAA